MKFTDRFFEIPVRIYDRYTAEKAETQEKLSDAPMDGDWVIGHAKVPLDEISTWSDYFDSVLGAEGATKEGFSDTLIFTWNVGAYICTWNKQKFEKELNIYADKYEQERRDEIGAVVDKIQDNFRPNQQL